MRKYLHTGLLKQQEGTVSLNSKVLSEKERMLQTYFVMQDSDYQLFTESVEQELSLEHEGEEDIIERKNDILEALGLADYKVYLKIRR